MTWVVSIVLGRRLFPVNTQLGNHCLVPLTVLNGTPVKKSDMSLSDTFALKIEIILNMSILVSNQMP